MIPKKSHNKSPCTLPRAGGHVRCSPSIDVQVSRAIYRWLACWAGGSHQRECRAPTVRGDNCIRSINAPLVATVFAICRLRLERGELSGVKFALLRGIVGAPM